MAEWQRCRGLPDTEANRAAKKAARKDLEQLMWGSPQAWSEALHVLGEDEGAFLSGMRKLAEDDVLAGLRSGTDLAAE